MKLSYPLSRKDNQVDNYFGTKVKDPYRWLENDSSPETKVWVESQNKVTFDFLGKIPFREKIRDRITHILNYPKYGAPFRVGEYYFFDKNDGLQNQSVWYIQNGLNGDPEIFLDPNDLAADGTITISPLGASKNNKFLAYAINRSGSDWQEIGVMDIVTNKPLSDKLEWVKFSGVAWYGEGFYYSRYDIPENDKAFSNKNEYHKVYYHKLGESQEHDELIYEDKNNPLRYFGAQTTPDEKFLILYISEGTDGTEIYCKNLITNQKDFTLILKGFDDNAIILNNDGDKLIMLTDADAPNKRIVLIDPLNPTKSAWTELIPEKPELLESASTAGNKIFVTYLKDVTTRAYQYSYTGILDNEILLPALGTAVGFSGNDDDTVLFYTFTSFTYPSTIFKYEIVLGTSELFRTPEVKFNPEDFETKQIFYTSKDGTRVPMFIVHKKGITLDGNRPTLLYGYGGFNVTLTPAFSSSRLVLLENDGVFVMTNLRGGGEYGEKWHEAGMLLNKQNVFDDFIAAAEYLILEKYTSCLKLAMQGGSNGGLLVGAVMTQRPDLFKVAFPQVGVLDMLRYHKFTIGWGWAVEYGSSENQLYFSYLLGYSPLHNLKAGVAYPATMITTADHDDRVVPAHSFKFAAALQEVQIGYNPALIRIDTKAGHGAGKPISKIIDEQTDCWSFMFYAMEIEPSY